MKLNSLNVTKVKVEDLTFDVKLSWGKYRQIAKEQSKIDEGDSEAQIDFMEKVIKDCVIAVSGLEDDNGEVKWSVELLDELSPSIIKELTEGIFSAVNPQNPLAETSEA